MARSPCCDENGVKKGPWTPEEDKKLRDYIQEHGLRSWRVLPALAGLNRCGKSCRLRWTNYLRPDIKRGNFTEEEEEAIIRFHSELGNKWSVIATHLPGRTDNEIKNHWNTHLRKKLLQRGIDPVTHKPRPDLTLMASLPNLLALASNVHGTTIDATALRNATQLARLQLLQSILNLLATNNPAAADVTTATATTAVAAATFSTTPSSELDPNLLLPHMNSSILGYPVDQINQFQGLDVSHPMQASPDIGMDVSNMGSLLDIPTHADPGCTSYVPEYLDSGLLRQPVDMANVTDSSPSTSSASNLYDCDYDAWGGLEELVRSDFYPKDAGLSYDNCF